nr:FHIPEP family type III secretion protein [Halobacillus massiliensis]
MTLLSNTYESRRITHRQISVKNNEQPSIETEEHLLHAEAAVDDAKQKALLYIQQAEEEIQLKRNEWVQEEKKIDTIEGIDTKEPAFGLPAKWITEDMKDEAELSGYTVVDPPSVVSTHITEMMKRHAHQLLGRQETQQLIDHLKASYPILVEEVTPEPLSVGEVQKVLSKLLKEDVSIKNLPVIFETLADFGKMTNDTDLLVEYVRQSLSAQITKQYISEDQNIRVVTVSGKVEKLIADHIQQTEHGSYLSLNPESQQGILNNVSQQIDQASLQVEKPVILCSPAVRMYVKQLLERYYPQVIILSYNELEPTVEVESIGVVNI